MTITDAVIPEETRQKVSLLFTRDEIKQLTARSDLRGAWAVLSTWALLAGAFAVLAWAADQPLRWAIPAFVVGLSVIAGRQLCLAILMHDAAHGTLFKTRWFNQVLADWACARPIWNDLSKYRAHHLIHHAKTGTDADTDLSLVTPFPCSRRSLARKFLRDLSGLTGLKFFAGRLLMDMGYLRWTIANDVTRLPAVPMRERLRLLARNASPTVIVNALLFALLWAAGHPWLFVAWVAAYMTPFSLFVRIRSLAEHACTERSPDMFRNTRTTRAGWFARATVAPLRVNYHLEHHAMPGVPYFRLPAMHRMLREQGVVPEAPGYVEVMKIVSS
jgi:fatty acid desaturase